KIFACVVSVPVVVAIVMFGTAAHSEIYIGEGSYVMSAGEDLGVAKERAKVAALRNAIENAGVYVKSYALAKNFNPNSDAVEVIAVNVVESVGKPNFNIENRIVRVTVKAQVDDDAINRLLNVDLHENITQYKALRRGEDKQEKYLAELKSQSADNPDDKELLAKKFSEADKVFLSHQKLHEALKLYNKGDYKGTIRLCNEAIRLNPTYNFSYNNRALALMGLERYEQAIEDFGMSIRLHPACFNAYNNRGEIYRRLNQYDKAIDDHNNAIRIKPTSEDSYLNRGLDYYYLGEYEKALQDFDKAIELNPNYNVTYSHRGKCYQALGDEAKAQADFAKAKELGYNR
ncbi:MAG: tetratricopeptide repeat protein, partial [Selenomonadaceae bacterium]|nr:tetratricopeptide repeat protein [Selenomonadaceae bacterium]